MVNGAATVRVEDGHAVAEVKGPDGHETYRVPLPAVVTVLEGGVEPRYPTVPGRMKAKKVEIETRTPVGGAGRLPAGQAAASAAAAEQRPGARQGRRGCARRGRPVRAAGGVEPMILVLVETDASGAVEVSRETITFARGLSAAGGGVPVDAVVIGELPVPAEQLAEQLASYGVRDVHHVTGDAFSAYGGASWASAVLSVRETTGSVVVTAAGTPRGLEVLAHVAARAGVAMAANVVAFDGLAPFTVTRQVLGGAVLEEMVLDEIANPSVSARADRADPEPDDDPPRAHERFRARVHAGHHLGFRLVDELVRESLQPVRERRRARELEVAALRGAGRRG